MVYRTRVGRAGLAIRRSGLGFATEVLSRTRLRRFVLHHYDYMQTPGQLAHLMSCLDETEGVPGSVVEIGCAFGATTVLLNKYLKSRRTERDYVCIDTFSGFTPEDISEERKRGYEWHLDSFSLNKRAWFERTLALNNVTGVRVVQGDISTVELPIGAVSMCLIDVDLYRPVLASLDRIWPILSDGGIILVDDVARKTFPYAGVAYREFVERQGIQSSIREDYGIARKAWRSSEVSGRAP
jgi:predicted O-methyltransferase YrrM